MARRRRQFDRVTRLSAFSTATFFVPLPMVVLSGGFDDTTGDLWQIGYDIDSVESANDPVGIVNDHRYARVGGTQQLFPHPVSIGRFGRSTRARNDLICTSDADALAVANAGNDREARTALRVEAVTVTATARPGALLAVAAIGVHDGVWMFPPAAVGFAGAGIGQFRSMTHTIIPMGGRVHWTATYAIDFDSFNDLPGAMLQPA